MVHPWSDLTAIATWLVLAAETPAQHRSKEAEGTAASAVPPSLQYWQPAQASFGSVSRENLIWESRREKAKFMAFPR